MNVMYKSRIKRVIDIVLSFGLIVILSPLFLLISVILFIELGAFPIFFQTRALSLRKRKFTIFKFRTLKENDSSRRKAMVNEMVFLKPELEKFVTPFTAFLRKTGLDELPQLFNVLLGNMSIIGPRPLMISDLQILEAEEPKLLLNRDKINSLPGITGLWQTLGNRQNGLKNMIELDLLYDKGISFSMDFIIGFVTIPFVFLGWSSDAILSENRNTKIKFLEWILFFKEQMLLRIRSSSIYFR